jgi:hypothetical protein
LSQQLFSARHFRLVVVRRLAVALVVAVMLYLHGETMPRRQVQFLALLATG